MNIKSTSILMAIFMMTAYLNLLHSQCLVSNQTQLQACMNTNPTNIRLQSNFVITSFLTMANNTTYNITTNGFNATWSTGFSPFINGNGNTTINITATSGTISYPNNNGASPNVSILNGQGAMVVTILPVELFNWQAWPLEGAVQLKWETSSELSNEKFIVERSQNGRDFQPIGEVGGSGTSLVHNAYDFADNKPLAGSNYYRLQQQDFDGSGTYSPIIAVNWSIPDNSIEVFPTVVSDHVTVKFREVPALSTSISLHTLQGNLVFVKQVEDDNFTYQFTMTGLPSGQYLLSVADGIETKQKLLVKQ